MDVIKGTIDHTAAVAEFWNAKAQDPSSWWFGSPTRTREEIADLLAQGLSLVVAIDGKDLVGFGMWFGPRLLGFTADDRDVFYRMMRVWAQENPGQRGISVIPARDTREKRWTDELRVAEVKPFGHKPQKLGDDPATRKVWICRADGDLDSLLAAIDRELAEVTR